MSDGDEANRADLEKASTSDDASPRVSVVVRSYGRLAALAELLETILAQDHDSFEVVVVEQTQDPDAADLERLQPMIRDPRVQWLERPPIGGAAARNEGVRHARGDIVLLIDDDDLPLVSDWIRAHERAYDDPEVVGVTARMVREPGEGMPYTDVMRPFVRRTCMSYSPLKTPFTYARFDEDVEHVEWLHGSNASFRRELGLRAGLWDTTVRSSDEHSFAFKARRVMSARQHFTYRAYPPAQQRLDIRGGMDKRYATVRDELLNNLRYCHRIVGTYHPKRFKVAYPVYMAWTVVKTISWAQDSGRRHVSPLDRAKQIIGAVTELPTALRTVRAEQI